MDKKEFDRTFRMFYAELFVFANQIIHNETWCRDLVSDAFESAWMHIDTLQANTARAYLYKSVRNNCVNFLARENHKEKYITFYKHITTGVDDTDFLAERDEREAIINDVLMRLPEPSRDIFKRCYVDGKKYKEVASELGISTSTIKKYIMKALKEIENYHFDNRKKNKES